MDILKLVLISMTPLIELRGAIPIGIAMGLNPITVYLSCVFGSTLVGIPLILFFRHILKSLKRVNKLEKFAHKIENKLLSKVKSMKKVNLLGLILFVGVPLPSTGSWSASGIASLLEMRIRDAIIGIFLGNALAGIIVLTISLHIF